MKQTKKVFEIQQRDVVGYFRWPQRVFINGIANSPLSCDACRSKGFRYRLCALVLNADVPCVPDVVYQREERWGASVRAIGDKSYRIWGGGQETKPDKRVERAVGGERSSLQK
jgi:hypothetical protein